jgi:cytochrome c
MRQWTSARPLLLASTTAVLLLGCSGGQVESIVAGGDPDRGRVALDGFGCGACHLIPGIRGARGMVGPPLTMFARRAYIAGRLPNSPDNLVRWIQDPQAVDPETAMPDLDVVPAIAADMAAYLYTLR